MSILSDVSIKKLCISSDLDNRHRPMIEPFVPYQIRTQEERKILSYGLSSAGYDVRLEPRYKIFTNMNSEIIDPLIPSTNTFVDKEGESVIIPPNSYLLGLTMEYFCLPKNVIALAIGKSSLARVGAIVNVTPIEPGWEGKVVIEIANTTPLPLRVHSNMGVAQFLFIELDGDCDISYADRNGKYQGQNSILTARV